MDKISSLLIGALILGGIIGYVARGSVPSSQNLKSSAMPQSNEAKIKNAVSAAPGSVVGNATIFDWPAKEGAELTELQKGTSDWTCLPDYPSSPGNDPICVDKTAMQWFQAYMTQKEPHLTQAGIGYMLQGGSDASNTDPFATTPANGEDWVTAPAHVMVFPTGKLDPNVYGTDPKKGGPWIMWAGTPYEHLMVPVI